MPYHVLDLVCTGLNSQGKVLRDSRVLVLGVAFKRDVDDARNSPAQRIIELLLQRGARVQYNDPYVPCFHIGHSALYHKEAQLTSEPLTAELLGHTDCVVIVAGHTCYDYASIADQCTLVVDTVNATQGVNSPQASIVRLGAPYSEPSPSSGAGGPRSAA
jgi:UDP-N-acetyl-D-glucosamine dehydrogenase